MHGVQRPLSPYWIYRWEITMWLSSLHRITGLLLSLGAVALAVWLIALATGPDSFATVSGVVGSAWFKPFLIGCYGFDPKRIRATGWTVVVVAFGATVAFSAVAIF